MKAPGLGIDGCKYGWMAVEYQHGGTLNHFLLKDIKLTGFDHYKLVFIDMPIGLISSSNLFSDYEGNRHCDMEARAMLKPYRQFSVFIPPVREALTCNTFEQANKVNKKITGKKISKQAYNLAGKIKSIDQQLTSKPDLAEKYLESHPEVIFCKLNKNRPMRYNKKTREGIRERMYVLQNYIPDISIWTDEVIFNSKRRDFDVDDLLDAAALAVGSYYAVNFGMQTLPAEPERDEFGLPMQMAVPIIPAMVKVPGEKVRV